MRFLYTLMTIMVGLSAQSACAAEKTDMRKTALLTAITDRPLLMTQDEKEAISQAQLSPSIPQDNHLPEMVDKNGTDQLLTPATLSPTDAPIAAISPPLPPAPVWIGGLVYVNASDWTIWINDEIIRAGQKNISGDYEIVEINPHAVAIRLLASADGKDYSAIIRPNQTWLPVDNRLVTGDKRSVFGGFDQDAENDNHDSNGAG